MLFRSLVIFPRISSLCNTAVFSPGVPFDPRSIFVISDLNILPFKISRRFPLLFSIISWPKAPNILVFGSR